MNEVEMMKLKVMSYALDLDAQVRQVETLLRAGLLSDAVRALNDIRPLSMKKGGKLWDLMSSRLGKEPRELSSDSVMI